MQKKLAVRAGDAGRRLDRLLRRALPALPLSRIHRLLREGRVLIDGKRAGPDARPAEGSIIEVPVTENQEGGRLPNMSPAHSGPLVRPPWAHTSCCATPQARPFPPILWEGESLLVLNKPAGLLVHGGEDSLEALVRRRLAPTLAPSLSFRPGPLHRLDRGTSGIIVFSKTLAGAQAFSALLRRRLLVKRYLALLSGRLGRAETWDDPLARDRKSRVTHRAPADGQGREALSRVTPLETRGDVTLALIEIRTGRTHQIRAQAALHGHPLSGDRKYGGPPPAAGTEGFSLHAWELEFPASLVFSPDPGLPRKITAPPPARGAWAHYRRVTSN